MEWAAGGRLLSWGAGVSDPCPHSGQGPRWWELSNGSGRKAPGSVALCVPAEEASRGTPSF